MGLQLPRGRPVEIRGREGTLTSLPDSGAGASVIPRLLIPNSRAPGPHPNGSHVNGLEPEAERRRILLKTEIAALRGDEQRVGDNRIQIVTALPPLLQRDPGKLH